MDTLWQYGVAHRTPRSNRTHTHIGVAISFSAHPGFVASVSPFEHGAHISEVHATQLPNVTQDATKKRHMHQATPNVAFPLGGSDPLAWAVNLSGQAHHTNSHQGRVGQVQRRIAATFL
eukprot:3605645-Amphidinium_carterae.1